MTREQEADVAGLVAINAIGWSCLITCLVEGLTAPLWSIVASWGLAYYVGQATRTYLLREDDDQTV